jgi:Na+-driven multidrug efflux pump
VVTVNRPSLTKEVAPHQLTTFALLAGGLMCVLEAGFYNCTAAIGGRLGTVAVAAHSVLLTTNNLAFVTFPYAVSCAASIRCAHMAADGVSVLGCKLAAIIRGVCMAACSHYIQIVLFARC